MQTKDEILQYVLGLPEEKQDKKLKLLMLEAILEIRDLLRDLQCEMDEE